MPGNQPGCIACHCVRCTARNALDITSAFLTILLFLYEVITLMQAVFS